MRVDIRITETHSAAIDDVGAVVVRLVEGEELSLPRPAADRIIARGRAVELVDEPEEGTRRRRGGRKAAAEAGVEAETEAAAELDGEAAEEVAPEAE